MLTVKMSRVVSAVTNKKLAASGVASGMRHTQNTTIVVLVIAIELTGNLVTGTTGTNLGVARLTRVGTAALNYKVGNHPMKSKAVVITFFGQFYKVSHRSGRIFMVKINFHYSLGSMNLSTFHSLSV